MIKITIPLKDKANILLIPKIIRVWNKCYILIIRTMKLRERLFITRENCSRNSIPRAMYKKIVATSLLTNEVIEAEHDQKHLFLRSVRVLMQRTNKQAYLHVKTLNPFTKSVLYLAC